MVAGIHNLAAKIAGALRVVATTASTTLTTAQIMDDGLLFVQANSTTGHTITLPAAAAQYAGRFILVGNCVHATNNITLDSATDGFGGTSSLNAVTIDGGEVVEVFCDGTYWYVNSATVAA